MSDSIKFKISETSLRYGIYNNYVKGHTATVETELNQSSDKTKWKHDILNLRNKNCRYSKQIPEMLLERCLGKSKNKCEITDLFIFDNILVNGVKLDVNCQYAMYIKKEISLTATKIGGKVVDNTHYGRLKLHYPISLQYKCDGININNRKVLETIMKTNGNYAFVVKGFIYTESTNTLNFLISLVGPNGILQTSVFKEGKGVGQKLKISDDLSYENNMIVTCKQNIKTGETEVQFEEVNKTRSKNGLKGEEFVYELLKAKLLEENDLFHTSKEYPLSPYDIEYIENGEKVYVEVKSTQTNKEIFNLSAGEFKFMKKYKENYVLYMVTNINSEFPKYNKYTYKDIIKMKIVPTHYKISV